MCSILSTTEVHFCKNCGAALASATKTNERTVEDQKYARTSAPSVKSVGKVPEWNTNYPSLSNATDEQKSATHF
jgi:hypothetical protein